MIRRSAIARRDVEAAAKGDREVGEIPANTAPLGIGFCRRAGRAGVFVAKSEMIMHKVANGLNARPAERRILEKTPSFFRQDVGLAIAAAEQKLKSFRGQMLDLMLQGIRVHWIRCSSVADDCICPQGEAARGSHQPIAPVAETVTVAFDRNGRVCYQVIGTLKV